MATEKQIKYWNSRRGKKMPLRSEEHKRKLSKSLEGRVAWNKGTRGLVKPNSGSFRKGQPPPLKGKRNPKLIGNTNGFKKGHITWNTGLKGFRSGSVSNFWKGGVNTENAKIRNSLEYKLWRKSVFERDNYTCIWCGIRSGNGKAVILNADHIKPFALIPELRLAIDNGRTLCRDCHQKTDTYMGRIKRFQ